MRGLALSFFVGRRDQPRAQFLGKDELVAQFGPRVLALPPSKGFDLVAYLAPAAAVLLGIAAVTTVVLRRRRRGPARAARDAAAPGPALTGDDAARLEADLQRYDL